MKKFLALYMAPTASLDEMMKNSTPEMQKKGMEDWMTWMNAHKSMMTDMGNPIGKNKRVTGAGVSDVRNEVCGYSIVSADSHDAAAAMFKDSPHLMMSGAYVEIMECMPIEGM